MTNDPTIADVFSALTMSRREIAELTGKTHKYVIRYLVLSVFLLSFT